MATTDVPSQLIADEYGYTAQKKWETPVSDSPVKAFNVPLNSALATSSAFVEINLFPSDAP